MCLQPQQDAEGDVGAAEGAGVAEAALAASAKLEALTKAAACMREDASAAQQLSAAQLEQATPLLPQAVEEQDGCICTARGAGIVDKALSLREDYAALHSQHAAGPSMSLRCMWSGEVCTVLQSWLLYNVIAMADRMLWVK